MDIITLEGEPRDTGTKAARATRRSGRVPCVLYGHSADNVVFTVEELALHRLVFTDELHRVQLNIGGTAYDCIIKDIDFHPVTDQPRHADFQLLRAGETIELSVPLQLTGRPIGVLDEGGELQQILHELQISVLPKDIPESLEIDVASLALGDTLHVADLSFENIEIVTAGERSVVTIARPRVEEVEEEVEEGLVIGEGEEGAEGDEEGEETDSDEG